MYSTTNLLSTLSSVFGRSIAQKSAKTMATVELLGTGASLGVPVLGCDCECCKSNDPRDRRMRTSALIRVSSGCVILIDCGPEFRLQALRSKITSVDFVLITHIHADHIHGVDDLRGFTAAKSVSLFALPSHVKELSKRFQYAFGGPTLQVGGGLPRLQLVGVESSFVFDSIRFDPIPLNHGDEISYGYRLGNFAYLTDGNSLSEDSYAKLAGVELVVLNASNPQKAKKHFTFGTACDVLERIRPNRAWFTHINHDVTHAQAEAWIEEAIRERPGLAGIEIHPGYDGLIIDGIALERVENNQEVEL
jgi:phosphoribosyl 1,2-cyclic phosphate phosphodiesterase